MTKTITCVIVTLNSAAVIVDCINSIPRQCEVVLVDNSSTDDTVALARQSRNDIHIIQNERNLGFGVSCNIGAATANTSYLLFLNPDARLEPDSLDEMLRTANHYPETAMVAPILYFENGTPQLSFRPSIFQKQSGLNKNIIPEGDLCAEFVSGACMLVKTSIFNQVGGFDNSIFLFYEDDDLCLKIRNTGHSIILTPIAKVIHIRGHSSVSDKNLEIIKHTNYTRSRIYLERKYKGPTKTIILQIKLMMKGGLKLIMYSLSMNKKKTFREYYRLLGCFS